MSSCTSVPLLIQMVVSLGWRDILILHDDSIETFFFTHLEIYNITSVNYDITSSTDEHLLTVLTETHHLVQPVLNVLLLCDHPLAVRVIHQMETFDAVSSFPVDICHSSRVLMVDNCRDLDDIITRHILLENIAVVEMPDVQNSNLTPMIWTLLFTENGRVFTPVSSPTWPTLKLSTVFPNTQYGYNGRQITVVMKHYQFPHGYMTEGDMILSGITYRTLDYMAKSLNFSPKVIYPREDEWGRDINGSWTGVIGMLQRKEADLAAEPLTINSVREAVVDHILPPLMKNQMMIIYKIDDDEDNLKVYLRPFQTIIYIALIGTLVMFSFLLCFERLYNKIQPEGHTDSGVNRQRNSMQNKRISHVPHVRKQSGSNICMTFVSTLQESFMAFLRQGVPKTASRGSERLLVSSWWLFTIIMTSVYCGAISSSFTVRKQKPPFTNLGELAKRQDYTIGYDSSAIIATYLDNSTKQDAVLIRNRIKTKAVTDPDVMSSDLNKHYDRVQQGKYAFLVNDVSSQYKPRTNCRLKTIDFEFGDSYFSFAVPKHSPFKKDFETSMYRLQDNGVLQQIREEWLRSVPEDRCDVSKVPEPISLTQLHSIFIVVGVGICCAAVVLFVEKIWFKVITTVYV